MANYRFTMILEHTLKHIIPESSDRRRLRLELCEVFGLQDEENKIALLNHRCKSGKEPTYSEMIKMIKAFGRYGIGKDEIFDKDRQDNENKN